MQLSLDDLFQFDFEGERVFNWAGYEEPNESDFHKLAIEHDMIIEGFHYVFNSIARYWMAAGVIKEVPNGK